MAMLIRTISTVLLLGLFPVNTASNCDPFVPIECDCDNVNTHYNIMCKEKGLSKMPDWPNDSQLIGKTLNTLSGDFSKNQLSSIPKNYFFSLYFTDLNLSRNMFRTVQAEFFGSPPEKATNPGGPNNQWGGLDDRLEKLDMSYNQISSIEADAFRKLEDLRELHLSYNQLPSICKVNHNFLTGLDASNNRIGSLNVGCFEFMRNLVKLNLKGNALQDVHPEAFRELGNLKELVLDGNPLKDPRTALQSVPRTVEVLSLADVGLTNLDMFCDKTENSPTGLYPQIRSINLAGNRISELTEFCFRQYKGKSTAQGLTLDFQKNLLTSVKEDAFDGLESLLKVLYIGHNQVVKFSKKTFQELNNLEELNADYNYLIDLEPICSWEGLSLKRLSLANNHITSIPLGCFSSKGRLRTLNLRGNRLLTLRKDTFASLPEINTLDLSANLLTDIENGAFKGLDVLRSLFLSGNALTTMKYCSFKDLTRLNQLFFGDNLLYCDCQLKWLLTRMVTISQGAPNDVVPLEKDVCTSPQMYHGDDLDAVIPAGCPKVYTCSDSAIMVISNDSLVYNVSLSVYLNESITDRSSGATFVIERRNLNGSQVVKSRYPISTTSSPVVMHGMNDTGIYQICLIVNYNSKAAAVDCQAWPEQIKDPPPPTVAPIPAPDPHANGGSSSSSDAGSKAAVALAVILIIIIILAAVIIVLMWRKMNGYVPPQSHHAKGKGNVYDSDSLNKGDSLNIKPNGNGRGKSGKTGMSHETTDDNESLEIRRSSETLPLRMGAGSVV